MVLVVKESDKELAEPEAALATLLRPPLRVLVEGRAAGNESLAGHA